jgi:hypothetical protein
MCGICRLTGGAAEPPAHVLVRRWLDRKHAFFNVLHGSRGHLRTQIGRCPQPKLNHESTKDEKGEAKKMDGRKIKHKVRVAILLSCLHFSAVLFFASPLIVS